MLRLSARSAAIAPSRMPLSAAASTSTRARAVTTTTAKSSQQQQQRRQSTTTAIGAAASSAFVSSSPSPLRSRRLAPAKSHTSRRRCSTTAAAAPAAAAAASVVASVVASVAAAAESARAAVLAALAAVLPDALSRQLAQLSPAASLAFSALAAVAAFLLVKKVFDTPSRKYDPANPNVGDEYDAWTREGILEHYWGEHIHLGYYTPEERQRGYLRKDFKRAKVDFVDKMLEWSGVRNPGRPPVRRVLDVGCGIGGTSRLLARAFPEAQVAGITLSTEQVTRATQLAHAQGLENVTFRVMDALALEFEEGSFDLVWACESGEHMADKKRYVEQMTRALAPGGTLVIATWCQREAAGEGGADDAAREAGTSLPPPLSGSERERLQFLYDEWAHPYFVSVEEYGRMLSATGQMTDVAIADWTRPTINTWRHSNWVGVFDPWPVVKAGPRIWYRVLREIVTLERMHRAFACGLMVYGMARAVKKEKREEDGGAAEAKREEVLSMVAA